MAEDFGKKFIEQMKAAKEAARQQMELEKELEQGLGNYVQAWGKIKDIEEDILHIKKQKAAKEKEAAAAFKVNEAELNKLLHKQNVELKELTKEEKRRLAEIQAINKGHSEAVRWLENEEKQLKKNLEVQKKAVKEANALKAVYKTTGSVLKQSFAKLRSWGVFDMDKEIRNAARSMGVSGGQFKAFSDNLGRAADHTTTMGVGLKDLAKLQGGYSKAIGRSVQLTEDGLKAMAEMSEGTGLGADFAIGMASAMDNFGMSAEASRDLVEETMQTAQEMGVNGAAASQALQKNLKLAQRYNFKGGVKALGKMSADAIRLKLDLDGIAGLADKVFRPEGAIEMAAQLSVMGGEFAKLGDPMTLMFKARNDFEGFAKDIGKATSEFMEYNKETGEFEVKGGLARDRMREISKMTGISVEKLQEMAKEQKKLETIGSIAPVSFSEEDKELIASVSKFNEETGKWEVKAGNFKESVDKLTEEDLKTIRGEQKNLEERAKQAQTFDEDMKNLLLSLKQLLLPVVQGLKTYVSDPLVKLQKEWADNGFYDKLRDFAKGAVDLVGTIATFIKDNPIKILVGALTTGLIAKAATWIFNGRMLRLGFNMGGPMGGGTPGMPGGGGASSAAGMVGAKGSQGLRMASKVGRFARGAGGAGAGVLAGVISGYNEWKENEEKGMSTGENVGRTATRGLAAGGGAWGGAAAGAAIGTMIFPGVGTAIGGLLGGIAGGLAGDKIGDVGGDLMFGDSNSAGKNRTIKVNDAAIEFNPMDNFTSVDNVLLSSTDPGQLRGATQDIKKSRSRSIEHKGEVKHTVKVVFKGLSDRLEQMLDKETINTMAQEAVTSIAAGGKTPVNRPMSA